MPYPAMMGVSPADVEEMQRQREQQMLMQSLGGRMPQAPPGSQPMAQGPPAGPAGQGMASLPPQMIQALLGAQGGGGAPPVPAPPAGSAPGGMIGPGFLQGFGQPQGPGPGVPMQGAPPDAVPVMNQPVLDQNAEDRYWKAQGITDPLEFLRTGGEGGRGEPVRTPGDFGQGRRAYPEGEGPGEYITPPLITRAANEMDHLFGGGGFPGSTKEETDLGLKSLLFPEKYIPAAGGWIGRQMFGGKKPQDSGLSIFHKTPGTAPGSSGGAASSSAQGTDAVMQDIMGGGQSASPQALSATGGMATNLAQTMQKQGMITGMSQSPNGKILHGPRQNTTIPDHDPSLPPEMVKLHYATWFTNHLKRQLQGPMDRAPRITTFRGSQRGSVRMGDDTYLGPDGQPISAKDARAARETAKAMLNQRGIRGEGSTAAPILTAMFAGGDADRPPTANELNKSMMSYVRERMEARPDLSVEDVMRERNQIFAPQVKAHGFQLGSRMDTLTNPANRTGDYVKKAIDAFKGSIPEVYPDVQTAMKALAPHIDLMRGNLEHEGADDFHKFLDGIAEYQRQLQAKRLQRKTQSTAPPRRANPRMGLAIPE